MKWQYDVRIPVNLAAYHAQSIRYSLSLPGVACAVIGFANEDEVRKAVAVLCELQPLSDAERQALLEDGRKLAVARGACFGAVTG